MKQNLIAIVIASVTAAVVFLAAALVLLVATCAQAQTQDEITATGSACTQAGCAYTRHHRETLCAEDHARDGHQFRAQGILRSGEQVTVRDGSGVKDGVGCTNPRGGGRFQHIRGGWPGHWTNWRAA